MRPASAKDNRRSRHPVMLFYAKRSRRTIDNRGSETAVGMGPFNDIALLIFYARIPKPALPINSTFRSFTVGTLPPDGLVLFNQDISIDSISLNSLNHIGIGLGIAPGGDSEKS